MYIGDFGWFFLFTACIAQRDVSLPISEDSFKQIIRTVMPDRSYDPLQHPLMFWQGEDGYYFSIKMKNPLNDQERTKKVSSMNYYAYCLMIRQNAANFSCISFVPEGRSATLSDIRIVYYGTNITKPSVYRVGNIKRLLAHPNFVLHKPTTFYIHGYVELWTDFSVETIVRAYLKRGGYNLLVLDWANLAFGNYIGVGLNLKSVGLESGKALRKLLMGGLSLQGLHIVGHSMGAIVSGTIARYLSSKGYKVPRLTGLDPAYPGFYPPLLGSPVSANDAEFVDIMHTDGGGFGAPVRTGHVDFWPNAGTAKQPGCLPLTVPLTVEDFCSHWRSWRFWAEAVAGGRFLARGCRGYDAFLRGRCPGAPLLVMGLETDTTARGNFYLRTAAEEPFALGERGAE